MKKLLLLLLCFASFGDSQVARRPKLLVAIVIDQFRYDYLTRFQSDYKEGLAELMKRGAVFSQAYYEHFPTVTAIGHSTILSGATPSISGIVGNEWYDRATGKNITSVSDEGTNLIGVPEANRRGSSPHRMLVSTVADEIKIANGGKTRTVGISAKDRAAILPAGRMADGAYWFDPNTGNFVSSTWYQKALPQWADKFNGSRFADKYLNFDWTYEGKTVRHLDASLSKKYYDELERTPIENELIESFSEAAIEGEQLGQHDGTDVLTVSFSAHDRVGHSVGPHAPEMRDLSIRTDHTIGKLLKFIDAKVGLDNVVIAFTADHGVSPLPEYLNERKMPGGRITEVSVRSTVQAVLAAKYGDGKWVVGYSGPAPYLNWDLMKEKGLNAAEVQNTAADAVRSIPHIYRVYTRTQLLNGLILEDLIDRKVRAGFNAQRSSDLFIVAEPYYLFEAAGTSHGTPYNYDAHVPIILMGPGIKPGRYDARAAVNDIAPTLATLVGVETPSGSVGRVLNEAFSQ